MYVSNLHSGPEYSEVCVLGEEAKKGETLKKVWELKVTKQKEYGNRSFYVKRVWKSKVTVILKGSLTSEWNDRL